VFSFEPNECTLRQRAARPNASGRYGYDAAIWRSGTMFVRLGIQTTPSERLQQRSGVGGAVTECGATISMH